MTPHELRMELLDQLGSPEYYSKDRQWRHITWAEQAIAYRLRIPSLEATIDIALVLEQDSYDIPSDVFYIRHIRLMPLGQKLHKRSIDAIDALGNKPQGLPSFYARYQGKVHLDVKPVWPGGQNYSLRVRYTKRPQPLNDNSTAFSIPEEYHELILLGALYRAHYSLRDYEAGNVARAQFTDLLRTFISSEEHSEIWGPNQAVNLILPDIVR